MIRALLLVVLAGCPPAPAPAPATQVQAPVAPEPTASEPPPAAAPDGKLAMPDLAGKTFDEAAAQLRSMGFTYDLETQPMECEHAAPAAGKIDCQDPEPGRRVDTHALVRVNVFQPQTHPGIVTKAQTRQLIGMKLDKAKTRLAELGYHGEIDVREEKNDLSSGCQYDTVCSVMPLDFQYDAPITIVVNKSKLEINVPD